MPRAFGTTPHSEIARAFEAENRIHTYVEKLADDTYRKTYQPRFTLEETLTLLDALKHAGRNTFDPVPGESTWTPALAPRQLRGKILQQFGLTEEG